MSDQPSPPETIGIVSRVPPAPEGALREIEGTVSQLRAEVEAAAEKPRQARLLAEIGEIQERVGDETGAARDYLAAFNLDPSFREPLEGLVRLLERRRSLKNLGKIVDALLRVAETPQESARALLAKATHLEDAIIDLGGAKGVALEATELPPPAAELAQAWLTLEMLASKLEDASLREQALTERAKHAGDPTWNALLNMDLAKVRGKAGDIEGALAALETAREERTEATYAALVELERLVRAEPGLSGSDEARGRVKIFASALEAQASLLHESIQDPVRGDAVGVPRWLRSPMHMAGAWLRAADTHRAAGQVQEAASLLDRAMDVVSALEGAASEQISPALVNARIRMAELLGDTELAAKLAAKRMESEEDGGVAAALAMRVAEHAASEGDADGALAALLEAIRRDPACIPARALQLDLLADGGDSAAFAGQLEAFAENLTDDDARGRAYLLSAFVWGVRARNVVASKASLARAGASRVPRLTIARVARTISSVAGDPAWFEEAARDLIAASQPDAPAAPPHSSGIPRSLEETPTKATESEIAQSWFEIARVRLARGDAEGAATALQKLGALPQGAWLGRALEAFLPAAPGSPTRGDDRKRAAIEELALQSTDPGLVRGMGIVAAMRAHRAGDTDRARTRLRELAEAHGGDELIASYLADLERAGNDPERTATALAACAVQTNDPELAAALLIEAGLERWRHGDRPGAVAAFEEAANRNSAAAKMLLGWAARGAGDGTIDARRRSLEQALDAGVDPKMVALERFAVELSIGDPEEAGRALATLENLSEDGDFVIAAALARLAWPQGAADGEATETALSRLAAAGTDSTLFAAAERLRIARDSAPEGLVDAARVWFDVGGGTNAALEWLSGAMAHGDTESELTARAALAGTLRGPVREQLLAHVAMSRHALDGGEVPFVAGHSHATRLTNLELSPPGCDPRRRSAALHDIGGSLGKDGDVDALALAGWSLLAAGDAAAALEAFSRVTGAREADLAAWEGLRLSAEATGQMEARAVAAEMLGQHGADAARASEMWEQAGLDWLELGQGDRAEVALNRSFERDPRRAVAFDKLFRRVRERKDGDKLLAIIARRLEVAEEPPEMTKLFWEQARVLREKGDSDGALKALENVTMLEPDHVGALALTGEIAIRRGLFEEAATALARLSTLDAAPPKNRVTAGVAAVDLYENKLDRHDRALEVLLALHKAGLTTLPVRERLARAAGRNGAWREATSILEELMMERPDANGRIEAARLAVVIYRDRLGEPNAARAAIQKLLDEAPDDADAIDMLLSMDIEATSKRRMLERARTAVLERVQQKPTDLALARRLSNVARALGDDGLWQAALSTSIALGERDPQAGTTMLQLTSRKPRQPRTRLTQDESILRRVLAPGDEGPIAQLFSMFAITLAEALGPSLAAAGVGKKDKIDARSGLAVRNEIATWAGAFGFDTFDLYVGGKEPMGVTGIPGETPSLVIGPQVNAPLSPTTRGRVARELLGLLRGSTIVRWRDDTTIASIVIAACNLAEVRIEAPAYASLAEVDRLISKAASRKVKKALPDLCRAIVAKHADARAWSQRALMSQNRIAVVASGDIAATVQDITGQPLERLPALIPGDERVEELLRFALSPTYLELRRSLGLEEGG